MLVVHDWYGVTDHVRMRAEMLARLGYVAFAADLFGADVRPSAAEAPGVVAGYYGNRALWRDRVLGGFARLLEEPGLDQARRAAVGYCFGDEVSAFVDELRAAPTVDWELVTYSGAMHAFTVPSANSPAHGAQYDRRAEERSWEAMKSFLAETLEERAAEEA